MKNTLSSHGYSYPVAVSRLSEGETSREPQVLRAIAWLKQQSGGAMVVVTPRKDVDSPSLKKLVTSPGVTHQTWRGFSAASLSGSRVVYAWPDRQQLSDLWNADADAVVVIEWDPQASAEWISNAKPVNLLNGQTVRPDSEIESEKAREPLPNGVEEILGYVASMAAGYSSGLKWNEEDKLKADMMNRPERWASISVEQVRRTCRELGMRPNDVNTVVGFLQRRKDGRRFNVRSSYRDFYFN
ncbi:hypothetical protein [Paenarthrobacter nitroguajacolicus]|uniref:hypothetical protein n=1 Tax=Paenarthrobacter nitroguajacolicus TaxID=211146 RepID=UPI001C4D80F3|nr:hypothetical protein [Paenarthrobacter nitroguajacolicus]